MFKKFFIHSEVPNVKTYYWLTVFNNGWFINANWIFLALSLMSKSQLGMVDGGSFLIGTLVDLPSGAIADILGRRKTIIFARLIFTLACLGYFLSNNIWTFAIANILFFVGGSFYTGADQALLYDSLASQKKEVFYLSISTRIDLIAKITTFFASLLGAAAFYWHMRLPFVLLLVFSAISLAITFNLKEVKEEEIRKFNWREFMIQQKEGIKILVSKKLITYFPIFLIIWGTFVIFAMGILRSYMAIDYNFNGTEQSIIFGVLVFATGIFGLWLPKLVDRSSDYKVMISATAIFIAGFVMYGFFMQSKVWGLLVLFLISMSGGIVYLLSQKIVNDEVSSGYRATALSALSIVTKIPYIMFAFSIGVLAENNNLIYATRIIIVVGLISVLLSFLIKGLIFISRRI